MGAEPDEPEPLGGAEPTSRSAEPSRKTQMLVYFGLRQDDGSPVQFKRPTLRWMAIYSIVWGLLFPLLDGHPRGYVRDVVIDTLLVFITQVVVYGFVDWKRRRTA